MQRFDDAEQQQEQKQLPPKPDQQHAPDHR
jgi:hypothetical protein